MLMEAGEGVPHSVFEDSLDILFKKGYREAQQRGSGGYFIIVLKRGKHFLDEGCGNRCRKIAVWINIDYTGQYHMEVTQMQSM